MFTHKSFMARHVQGGPKKPGLYLTVHNFAMVNGKKARDMSKVSEFCPEKVLMSVHLNILCAVCINLHYM